MVVFQGYRVTVAVTTDVRSRQNGATQPAYRGACTVILIAPHTLAITAIQSDIALIVVNQALSTRKVVSSLGRF